MAIDGCRSAGADYSSSLTPLPALILVKNAAPVDSALGDDQVEGNIPGLCRQPVDALALVGETDQAGPSPVIAVQQIAEGAVIVPRAHAEAMTVGVEADQG